MRRRPYDLSDELKRDKRFTHRELSGSLMSNTKWRVVLDVLSAPSTAVGQVVVKFIDHEMPRRMEVPWTDTPSAFLDSWFAGPFSILSIEWLEIPEEAVFEDFRKGIPTKRVAQDLGAVRTALEATGKQLPIVMTGEALRIIGHVR